MKKNFIITSILSILLSVLMLSNCSEGYFCCEEQHQASSQCSTCTPHMETVFSNKLETFKIVFTPSLVGIIYFDFIKTKAAKFIFTLDRPPANLLS